MYVVLLLNTHGKNNSDELWIGFLGSLNEVQARQLAGIKALEFGWGGIS
ncbi:hypothetical protein C5S29_05350, partial [ANME-1 cluster archaeon GoMg3.2]|nr:hypothetical protein [ANME-1 cluster archaeon GoMg3.2]